MAPYGGFHELVGPLYEMRRGERIVVGMRVAAKHLARGPGIHGGMYFMLLDTAMTHCLIRRDGPDGERLVRGSATFQIVNRPLPKAPTDQAKP